MIRIDIPGAGTLELSHLVLDYNGTLAVDGDLLPGVAERIRELAADLTVHVVTADTFGKAAEGLADLPVALTVLPAEDQEEAKAAFVSELGPDTVAAVGNGRNDASMLALAALGIAVVLGEGGASVTWIAADVVAADIGAALDLLREPKRLVATLRR